MATYVALINFTQKGIETIKDGPARLDAAKKTFAAAGANLKALYLTMGRCDAVVIAEAPDDATMAKIALGGGAQGFIRTETMRAFTEEEYRKIVASLP